MNPPVMEQPKVLTPKVKAGILTGGPLRLNLGGAGEGYRDGRIPGFAVVDLRDVPDTDIVADIGDLSFLPDMSVDEIYASNCLEHFPHTQTVSVLKEWRRVLKPGAILWISVPDFDAAVRIYQAGGLTEWLIYHLWGDQAHPLNYHYVTFNFARLAAEVIEAGFADITRVVDFPFGIKDASQLVDSHFKIPISLNVKCVR
jgi:predicted SAM-dependent methyltransferase